MILAAAASDAGAYYVQAVNERNGENKTSPPMHLSIASECAARSDSAGAGGEVGATLGAGRVQGLPDSGAGETAHDSRGGALCSKSRPSG